MEYDTAFHYTITALLCIILIYSSFLAYQLFRKKQAQKLPGKSYISYNEFKNEAIPMKKIEFICEFIDTEF